MTRPLLTEIFHFHAHLKHVSQPLRGLRYQQRRLIASINTTVVGDSGASYTITETLYTRGDPPQSVYLAKCNEEKFILKELRQGISQARFERIQTIDRKLKDLEHVRTIHDMVSSPSMLVYKHYKTDFFNFVELGYDSIVNKVILREVLKGIAEMHENDVVHLDIKPQNVVLDWTVDGDVFNVPHLKIIDIDEAHSLGPNMYFKDLACGNFVWNSPEAWTEGPLGREADIFSFALVCLYGLSGKCILLATDAEAKSQSQHRTSIALDRLTSCFASAHSLSRFRSYLTPESKNYDVFNNLQTFFDENEKDLNPIWKWEGIDEADRDFMLRCTDFDVRKRISARDALEHPFWKDVIES